MAERPLDYFHRELAALGFLLVVASLHLVRLVLKVPIRVGGFLIPMWVSLPAFLGLCALATWLWREQKQ